MSPPPRATYFPSTSPLWNEWHKNGIRQNFFLFPRQNIEYFLENPNIDELKLSIWKVHQKPIIIIFNKPFIYYIIFGFAPWVEKINLLQILFEKKKKQPNKKFRIHAKWQCWTPASHLIFTSISRKTNYVIRVCFFPNQSFSRQREREIPTEQTVWQIHKLWSLPR